jgi:hypothetical protein
MTLEAVNFFCRMLGAGTPGVTYIAHLDGRFHRLERAALGLAAFSSGRLMAGNTALYLHLFSGNGAMNVTCFKQCFVAAPGEACRSLRLTCQQNN